MPTQEPGVRPSRRLGYRLHVGSTPRRHAGPDAENRGELGAHIQARSLTVPGGPYSYTIGAGDEITAALPNPGTYDLSLHGANGFFRHFAGRSHGPALEVHGNHDSGRLRVRSPTRDPGLGRHPAPVTVNVVDAYSPDRHIKVDGGTEVLVIDTHHSGGWYDVALSSPSDKSFSYQLAGRLESAPKLTSDPQLAAGSQHRSDQSPGGV